MGHVSSQFIYHCLYHGSIALRDLKHVSAYIVYMYYVENNIYSKTSKITKATMLKK